LRLAGWGTLLHSTYYGIILAGSWDRGNWYYAFANFVGYVAKFWAFGLIFLALAEILLGTVRSVTPHSKVQTPVQTGWRDPNS
jgi:hypothetical protein